MTPEADKDADCQAARKAGGRSPERAPARRVTRIQEKNTGAILDAALVVFSRTGYRGATLDQIAAEAGLSKPNLLYYFASKEAIHRSLLENALRGWLEPLQAINPAGEPLTEILAYVRRKIESSRSHPRESRLFANEILHGAERIMPALKGDLRALVDDKAQLIQRWMDAGRLRQTNPQHLIFSIWSLTQHYADFDVQVRAVLGPDVTDPITDAAEYLEILFTRLLKVDA